MQLDKSLRKTVEVIEQFVRRRMSGERFEKKYMKLWEYQRDKNISYSQSVNDILFYIYCEVDAFVSPTLLKELKKEDPLYSLNSFNNDENQLREKCAKALPILKKEIILFRDGKKSRLTKEQKSFFQVIRVDSLK